MHQCSVVIAYYDDCIQNINAYICTYTDMYIGRGGTHGLAIFCGFGVTRTEGTRRSDDGSNCEGQGRWREQA